MLHFKEVAKCDLVALNIDTKNGKNLLRTGQAGGMHSEKESRLSLVRRFHTRNAQSRCVH